MTDFVSHQELIEALDLLVGIISLFLMIYDHRRDHDHHGHDDTN